MHSDFILDCEGVQGGAKAMTKVRKPGGYGQSSKVAVLFIYFCFVCCFLLGSLNGFVTTLYLFLKILAVTPTT